jgi:hypothetical protein
MAATVIPAQFRRTPRWFLKSNFSASIELVNRTDAKDFGSERGVHAASTPDSTVTVAFSQVSRLRTLKLAEARAPIPGFLAS